MSIEVGLRLIELELESAFPSKNRTELLQMVHRSTTGVKGLKERAFEFKISLQVVQTVVAILLETTAIHKNAKSLFNDFKAYCAKVVTALPFWAFLPHNEPYIEHGEWCIWHCIIFLADYLCPVKRAVSYLAGRGLSLKFAHFLAAIDCLLVSE
jgi:hypothetical protein